MTGPPSDGNVSYTVKELLARIEGKVDDVLILVRSKADKADVDVLAGRVAALENAGSVHAQVNSKKIEEAAKRIEEVERQLAATGGVSSFIWKTLPIMLAAAAVAVSILLKYG